MNIPFTQRLVPVLPTADKFIDKFCRGLSGVGIVTGRKLVLDTRPGRERYLRYLWYGISYITGKDWSSYNPVPLSHGELQKVTWAWGGSQTRRRRERATRVEGRRTRRERNATIAKAYGAGQLGVKRALRQAGKRSTGFDGFRGYFGGAKAMKKLGVTVARI